MKTLFGKKRWFFPDGDLPPRGDGEPHGHESLVILNPNAREEATVRMTIYFTDQAPLRNLPVVVKGERVRCVRMDEPIGPKKFRVPFGQYALKLESNVPVIAQIGRMDVRQPNLAYYTVMGFGT